MKAVLKTAPAAGVEIRDVPVPGSVPAGHIRVKVAAASVCGTDRGLFLYTPAAAAFKPRLPVILGHEGSGIITEVGGGVTGLKAGDAVAFDSHIMCGYCYPCRTGNAHLCDNMMLLGLHTDGLFAEECVVDAAAAYRLPESIAVEDAALLEPAGVAMHALQRYGEPVLGRRVLITGGGPVGLFIAELARIAGASAVVVVEPNPFRRALAESFGAIAVEPGPDAIRTCREMSADRGGFDVGFEASGHPSGFPTIAETLRLDGTFVSVGFSSIPNELDTAEYLNRRGITFTGSFGRRLWSTWDILVGLVASGQLDLGKFITHRLPLRDFESAMELLTQDSCKVLLLPSLD